MIGPTRPPRSVIKRVHSGADGYPRLQPVRRGRFRSLAYDRRRDFSVNGTFSAYLPPSPAEEEQSQSSDATQRAAGRFGDDVHGRSETVVSACLSPVIDAAKSVEKSRCRPRKMRLRNDAARHLFRRLQLRGHRRRSRPNRMN